MGAVLRNWGENHFWSGSKKTGKYLLHNSLCTLPYFLGLTVAFRNPPNMSFEEKKSREVSAPWQFTTKFWSESFGNRGARSPLTPIAVGCPTQKKIISFFFFWEIRRQVYSQKEGELEEKILFKYFYLYFCSWFQGILSQPFWYCGHLGIPPKSIIILSFGGFAPHLLEAPLAASAGEGGTYWCHWGEETRQRERRGTPGLAIMGVPYGSISKAKGTLQGEAKMVLFPTSYAIQFPNPE